MAALHGGLWNDGRNVGRADKSASAVPTQGRPAGWDKPDLGGGVPESGYVCAGWEVDSIDGVERGL